MQGRLEERAVVCPRPHDLQRLAEDIPSSRSTRRGMGVMNMRRDLFRQNVIRGLTAGSLLLALPTCTTASEVTQTGPSSYFVTSAACPACGGTAKSASLAIEKAQQFCAASGKTMVMQNVESQNLNAVGAGGSKVEFGCAVPVSDDAVQTCYDTFLSEIAEDFGRNDTTRAVLTKLFATSDFKILSDATYPTETDTPVIHRVGEGIDKCDKLRMTVLPPAEAQVAKELHNKWLAQLAQLANKSITYGQYAMAINAAEDAAGSASALQRLAQRDEQRWQAEQRLRAAENLSKEINRLTQPPPR